MAAANLTFEIAANLTFEIAANFTFELLYFIFFAMSFYPGLYNYVHDDELGVIKGYIFDDAYDPKKSKYYNKDHPEIMFMAVIGQYKIFGNHLIIGCNRDFYCVFEIKHKIVGKCKDCPFALIYGEQQITYLQTDGKRYAIKFGDEHIYGVPIANYRVDFTSCRSSGTIMIDNVKYSSGSFVPYKVGDTLVEILVGLIFKIHEAFKDCQTVFAAINYGNEIKCGDTYYYLSPLNGYKIIRSTESLYNFTDTKNIDVFCAIPRKKSINERLVVDGRIYGRTRVSAQDYNVIEYCKTFELCDSRIISVHDPYVLPDHIKLENGQYDRIYNMIETAYGICLLTPLVKVVIKIQYQTIELLAETVLQINEKDYIFFKSGELIYCGKDNWPDIQPFPKHVIEKVNHDIIEVDGKSVEICNIGGKQYNPLGRIAGFYEVIYIGDIAIIYCDDVYRQYHRYYPKPKHTKPAIR